MEEGNNISRALALAGYFHSGQLDKGGAPYILHVLGVWNRVRFESEAAQIVAFLHDVVEDTECDLKSLYEAFGTEVGDAVDAISHRKGEKYFDYIARCAANPIAKRVKIADIEDNSMPERRTYGVPVPMERYTKAMMILTGERA